MLTSYELNIYSGFRFYSFKWCTFQLVWWCIFQLVYTYQGQYDDEEDFAYRIVEECYDLPEFAKTYFDYEKFARDLFMYDYWFDDGFVFRAA